MNEGREETTEVRDPSNTGRRRALARPYITVDCRCGKRLRAKSEQAGTEISCWNCKTNVAVPLPKISVEWLFHLLRRGARDVFGLGTATLLVLGSMLTCAALLVPGNGIVTSIAALTLVLFGYGEMVRRGSRPDWVDRPAVPLLTRIWRASLCLATAAAMLSPWLLAPGYDGGSPRLTKSGVAAGLAGLAAIPLVFLGTYAHDPNRRGPIRLVARTASRHPLGLLLALLLVPAAIVGLEGLLFLLTRHEEMFPFLVLDIFPKPSTVRLDFGIPFFGESDFRKMPDSVFIDLYRDRLRQGYTFVGALPASLALQTKNGFDPWALWMTDRKYLVIRLLFTLMVAMGVLGVMAVQARWLGLLASIDDRRRPV